MLLKNGQASSIGEKVAYFSTGAEVIGTSGQYMAIKRGAVVVVVSNVGAQAATDGFNVSGSQFDSGGEIVYLLSCTTSTVRDGGASESTANNGEARVSIYEIPTSSRLGG